MQFNNTDPIYVQLKDYYKKMILMGVLKMANLFLQSETWHWKTE